MHKFWSQVIGYIYSASSLAHGSSHPFKPEVLFGKWEDLKKNTRPEK